MSALRQCILLNPSEPRYYFHLKEWYQREGLRKEAHEMFDKAISLGGREPRYLYRKGEAYHRSGNLEAAIAPLLEYIDVSNQDDMLRPKACFLLATAYIQQANKPQAYEWYQKGVKADQDRLPLFPSTDNFPDRMLIEGLSCWCSQCRAMLSNPKRCAKCRIAVYCNADCQRAHWKTGHKNECGG
mmetsp:Transcript_30846/g.49894  ORF Transcript_30846/g.49894 Transcript_30846/m.49894 type:complete len:185 (-) Transcript_30846:4-558(-)